MNLSEVLEELFDGDVDAPTVFSVYMQDTALHRAVRLLNMEYVRVLVENGADVNAVGDLGYTPLHEATYLDAMEIAKFLIESGASTEVRNEFGDSPYECAKSSEMKRMINSYRQNWTRKY